MQQFFSLLSWRLFTAERVLGVFPHIIRSSMTAVVASGFRMNVEVEVFSASTFIQKPEAATAVWRAPDGGHNNAWNMLSTVCMTKL